MPHFQPISFVTNYVGVLAAAACYGGWKILHKTRFIPLMEIDLVTGRRVLDEMDEIEFRDEEKATGWKGKASKAKIIFFG